MCEKALRCGRCYRPYFEICFRLGVLLMRIRRATGLWYALSLRKKKKQRFFVLS